VLLYGCKVSAVPAWQEAALLQGIGKVNATLGNGLQHLRLTTALQ
jgi:hypothetical protein